MSQVALRATLSAARVRAIRALVVASIGLAGAALVAPTPTASQQAPATGADAQKTKQKSAPQQKAKKDAAGEVPKGVVEPVPKGPGMPNAKQMALLIQTYMVALSHANLTNNFTVLHALGAPGFQKENPPEKLSRTFSGFRAKGIDLLPIILYSPTLVQPPEFVSSDVLRVTGYYRTEPQQIHFDVLLQPLEGAWRLFGISVSTRPGPAAEAALK